MSIFVVINGGSTPPLTVILLQNCLFQAEPQNYKLDFQCTQFPVPSYCSCRLPRLWTWSLSLHVDVSSGLDRRKCILYVHMLSYQLEHVDDPDCTNHHQPEIVVQSESTLVPWAGDLRLSCFSIGKGWADYPPSSVAWRTRIFYSLVNCGCLLAGHVHVKES